MKKKKPKQASLGEALEKLEKPRLPWKIIVPVVVGFAVVWLIAAGLIPWVGHWGLVVAGLLTAVGLGFGVYAWVMSRRSNRIIDILKTATDAEGREQALEQLKQQSEQKSDAMAALARAQLLAQQDPAQAILTLEAVDLKKAGALVQDDLRANLALLYLMHGRLKDARPLADAIRLDRQPQAKARAMYAAVIAECLARSGKGEEATKTLEPYDPSDKEFSEVAPMLYRAQVWSFHAVKKRGLAKKSMEGLAQIDPNMCAAFIAKGAHPQLAQLARQVIQAAGMMPKPQRIRVR